MPSDGGGAADEREILTKTEVQGFFSWSSQWYDTFHRALFLGELPKYRRLAAEQVASEGARRCLDVATGTGENAIAFARAHPAMHVVAMDMSRDMLHTAREKRGEEAIEYVRASADRLPFRDNAFDLTTDSWAFNLLSQESCWPEILRVTRHGGIVADVDILHRFWDYWFLNPVVRPFILYSRIISKEEPLLVPRDAFFTRIGLENVVQQRLRKPLAVVQVTVGTRP